MDTSETYIKMRMAAIPDLKMGEPPCVTIGFPIHYMDVQNNVWVDKRGNWYHSTENDAVQLECQDQLQAMLGDFSTCLCVIYWWQEGGKILSDSDDYFGYDHSSFTSMEQLLLACVMWRKYSKIWNGTEWVKP